MAENLILNSLSKEESKKLIGQFIKNGYLFSPDIFEDLPKNFNKQGILELIKNKVKSTKEKPLILNKDLILAIKDTKANLDMNWLEFERSKAFLEKGKNGLVYNTFLDILTYGASKEKTSSINLILDEIKRPEPIKPKLLLEEKEPYINTVIVSKYYKEKVKKREVQDFISHYSLRYNQLKYILLQRPDLQNTTSINKIMNNYSREEVTLIGIVANKIYTKNGNILFRLEDPTTNVNIMASKNKSFFELAKDIMLDEVIGVKGILADKIIFANDLFLPDIPNDHQLKKSKDEAYVVFTSDVEVGSKFFYEKDFLRFIDWLNGNFGNETQKNISKKVKYLFIVGDTVAGVGIYPNQDKELVIQDIYKQYEKFAELISMIRKDIKIIICGGNHDALRLAEPQPVLDLKIAKPLWELPNVVITTNPSLINIHSSKDFSGFDVLMYHGYSYPYIADNVESIRKNGRLERGDLIMRYVLQRRHLAPTYSSNLFIPDTTEDLFVIEKVPDFLTSGHLHRITILNYRNVTAIGCGCWTGQTQDQEKRGIKPDPSRVILVNLKTRDTKILNFLSKE